MLNNYEKQLHEHYKTLNWDNYYKDSLNYNFNKFSEEFNNLVRDQILNKTFKNIEDDETPYEDNLEKMVY